MDPEEQKQQQPLPPVPRLVYRHWREGMNPDECVSVDGNAPGRLNLSHWPGNRTPAEFISDLSTGSALLLAVDPERDKWLKGFTTVTNNHWDTDGLCAAWTMLEPDKAGRCHEILLAAAMAGDFEMFTTPEGTKIDLTLTALTKHPHSPVHSGKYGTELERREAQYAYGLELLPKLIENPDLRADWFAREYWMIQKDMRAIREEEAQVQEYGGDANFAIVRGDRMYHRAAVNTLVRADRILVCAPSDTAWLYELRLSTWSWFQLETRPYVPRPDWAILVKILNEHTSRPGARWVAEDYRDPAPTLKFADEKGNLAPSMHTPEKIGELMKMFFANVATINPPAPRRP